MQLQEIETKAFGGTPEQAKEAANAVFIEINESHVAMGRAEYYRDRNNRVQLRWLAEQ
jgi:tRNA threonylcarbamoyladenosine modification (KEOPS) complex  Pcc1 subunit